jgi:hypothetical protein
MPVDYKYILFDIKNDKLSIFCILTHRYGKHRKSQSMKYLWTLVIKKCGKKNVQEMS